MRIAYEKYQDIVQTMLEHMGEDSTNAKIAAGIIAVCDARGISTHGSHMLTLIYARRKVNQLQLPTQLTHISNQCATALLDGNDGLGQIAAYHATKLAIQKAKEFGVSNVMIRNTNNIGALGVYAEMIAREKMMGLIFSNASPAMPPWGGASQFFGTQPFAIGIYTGSSEPYIADMASSQVARGKIRQALREGRSIPPDWALNDAGEPTTDPAQAIEGFLLPIGGAKGSAIAMAIDILAGVISGSNYAPDVRAIHYTEGAAGVGCGIVAIDIKRFISLDQYSTEITTYLERIKSMPRAKGFEEILIPGEAKLRQERQSKQAGVYIPDGTAKKMNQILAEMGLSERLV